MRDAGHRGQRGKTSMGEVAFSLTDRTIFENNSSSLTQNLAASSALTFSTTNIPLDTCDGEQQQRRKRREEGRLMKPPNVPVPC